MFRGLFGQKSDRPAPPKNQIEVICPACGAAQYEPRLVVSTFCKNCGVHLAIDRKRVTASEVTRSGARKVGLENLPTQPVTNHRRPAPSSAATPAVPPAAAPKPATAANGHLKPVNGAGPPPEIAQAPSAEELEEGGFGAFLKQQTAGSKPQKEAEAEIPREQTPVPEAAPVEAPAAAGASAEAPPSASPDREQEAGVVSPLARLVQAANQAAESAGAAGAQESAPASAENAVGEDAAGAKAGSARRSMPGGARPPTAAPAPMTASTLQRMKDQGLYRNQYFKDAECFECHHKFKVSRSSRSATCPACGAFIAMEDLEINMFSDQPVRTRGDVLIRKRGHLATDHVECKDLRCYGTLEANVDASGDAVFRSVGTVHGKIRGKRLIIEKGCDVTFATPVEADEIEIHARVSGSLISKGGILIGPNGSANGDVTARSVSIEPGGELNGSMNIVRTKPKPKPEEPKPEPESEPENSAAGSDEPPVSEAEAAVDSAPDEAADGGGQEAASVPEELAAPEFDFGSEADSDGDGADAGGEEAEAGDSGGHAGD